MNKKAAFIFNIIIILLFTVLFGSCKSTDANENNPGNTNQTTISDNNAVEAETTETTETTEIPDNLPEMDFGGYDFRIYIRDQEHYNTDFHAESETGDLINDAVYTRNKKVEERFNISIDTIFYPLNDNLTSVSKSILAGDDAYDVIAMHGAYAFAFGAEIAIDWFSNMPYINFDAPWWPEDIVKNLSAFGKLYCTTGDISYLGLNSSGCMMFNKDLFKNLGIDYPYEDVLNGKWTTDKFMSIVKSGMLDLDGDGVMSPSSDRYGVDIFNEWGYPITVFYSGGDRVITINADGTPELTVYNERTSNIFDKFFDLINSGGAYVRPTGGGGEFIENTSFKSGRALILATVVSDIIRHRDLDYEVGVLPYPKYDENTPKYYANPDAGQNVLVIPKTVSDTEKISIIIEALAAESYRSVMPAFYEVSLKTKYSRDEESEAMLDYIRDGIIFDYGYFNSSVAGDLAYIGRNLYASKNPNFLSYYEKWAPKAEENIKKLSDN